MSGRIYGIVKGRIGALVEAYMEFVGLDFVPTESLTIETECGLVKREADKSYELGSDRDRLDLVIEVVVTSGGIDRLEAYKRLQISEVWFWEKGRLSLYGLEFDGYSELSRSQVLPNLNIEVLAECINLPNHTQAVKLFRQSFN